MTNTKYSTALLFLIVCIFASYSQATTPKPIPNNPFFTITVWGKFADSPKCLPQFEYRIDEREIRIYLDDSLVETRHDAISIFKTLKTRLDDLTKLTQCANLSDYGIFIMYRGRAYTLHRSTAECKSVSTKSHDSFLRIIDGIVVMDSELKGLWNNPSTKKSKSDCSTY